MSTHLKQNTPVLEADQVNLRKVSAPVFQSDKRQPLNQAQLDRLNFRMYSDELIADKIISEHQAKQHHSSQAKLEKMQLTDPKR